MNDDDEEGEEEGEDEMQTMQMSTVRKRKTNLPALIPKDIKVVDPPNKKPVLKLQDDLDDDDVIDD